MNGSGAGLTPSPDPRILRHHPRVLNGLASIHRGRTQNETICPHSGHTIPNAHAHMATCPCGIITATWGNTLYIWPPNLDLPTPDKATQPLVKAAIPQDTDALYRHTGGSTISLTPFTAVAYYALLAAETGIAPGGADWAGAFPPLTLHAPTKTNVLYRPNLRPLYQRAISALCGLRMAHDANYCPGPHDHTDPDAFLK